MLNNQKLKEMNATDLITQIDNRINSGEYKQFPATANRLMQIRGKLLHKITLSKNDLITLNEENYYLG